MSGKGPDKKVTNKFVLLGSTAVLAVYSAGYVRTQKAAELVAEKAARASEARQRRLARVTVSQAPMAEASGVGLTSGVGPKGVLPDAVPEDAKPGSPQAALPADSVARGPQDRAAKDDKTGDGKTANDAKAKNDNKAKAAADAQAAAEAWKLEIEESDRAAAAAAAAAPRVSPKAPAAPATARRNPLSKWRDGTYHGYGTSFHGDIEAEIIIEGGEIVLASISKCQTRYPCDIIEHLVPQVESRQSAEVDNVTRATESADAFSTAVANALKQAERANK
jgi:uncharacterized protein with FMN-binding domain